MTTQTRSDSQVGLFLARELEGILSRVFEVEYADIKYAQLLPVSSEMGPGQDSFTYRVFDKQGSMKIIGDRASDLPRADILRKEVTHPIRSIGGSFGYTIQETRAASLVPGLMLEQRRANAVRRAYEEKMQQMAYFGEAAANIKGFFNNSQVDKLVPSVWFDTATTDELLELLNEGPTRVVQNSNMKETPNTLLVPYNVYRVISTRPRSSTSDTTILEFFLRTNPYITAVEPINELEASKSGGFLSKDRMICYNRSPDKLQFHIPQPLEFFPPERNGLEYTVAAHARCGGLAYYYPKSGIVLEKA
jgi:hypothetical protein